ncbi:Adenine phosphoribosyltransferase 5 isoform 1 [Hibiscus syriacus]|uniref:Adenine phosphoribosyltransferase 5 isoform 1 n=1 Tax=Hibiscus syriacus TaxID=106335 RepID=A0A6A2XT82_HIBSY|nr:Adenine phosphoribosyltransferase 5 isoform 1 [Hibiscus syriacus]
MAKLLSDIDLSRTVAVASFLELEVAASTISSNNVPPNSNISHFAGNSSIASDYGNDTAYETSELGTPRLGRDGSSEIGSGDLTLDEDLTGSIEKLVKYHMPNIDEQITETTNQSATEEKDAMLQELNATKEQLNDISKRYEVLEAKSKADIKVLVKEVKSLWKSQKELKHEAQLEQERKLSM